MTIEWRWVEGGGRELHLSGPMDFSRHREFSSLLGQYRSDHRRTLLEIDLSGVTIMNSAGLGLLLMLREKAEECGQKVMLKRCSRGALETLRKTNFSRVFEIRE